MFDSFMGLPLHVLVLHFTVVLVPIGALAGAAVFLRPAWRSKYAAVAAGVNVALLVLTFVTVRAGYAFQARLNEVTGGSFPVNNHEQWGERLLWVVVALASASVLAWLAVRRWERRSPNLAMALGVAVAGLAVGVTVLTVVTGHTGSQSRWSGLF